MKKYLKLLPLILYPYMYLILFIIFLIINNISGGNAGIENGFFIGIILLIVYNIYVLCISVYNAVITAKNDCKASEAAKINLIIKGSQIPAYIFNFMVGILGILMSVWGIGLIIMVIVLDVLTIILTGISSIGCAIKMNKERIFSTSGSILMAIGSFVFCIDIIIAIVYMLKSRKI